MITFTIDSETGEYSVGSILDKELNINNDEQQLVDIVLSYFPDEISSQIRLERRSKNYISMFYGANDFFRFKYTPKSKWISLRLPFDIAADNLQNPLFAAQVNKKQSHWKATLNSLDDLKHFKDFIIASCIYIPERKDERYI